MPTRRRILKYTPAVVMALLTAAWVVSCFAMFGCCLDVSQRDSRGNQYQQLQVTFHRGSASVGQLASKRQLPPIFFERRTAPSSLADTLGVFAADRPPLFRHALVPIAMLLAGLLPLAVGPFVSFRFRLWHYLAYTALVALELAFYLR